MILNESDYRQIPWKNGKGVTAQIAISPAEADFTKDEFLWRVSRAPILENGPFSEFPGYERVLVLLKGQAKLHFGPQAAVEVKPGVAVRFSGDATTRIEIVQGPVVDLGVIFHRERCEAQVQMLPLPQQASIEFQSDGGDALIYVAEGELELRNDREVISLLAGQTFVADRDLTYRVASRRGPSKCVWVTCQQKR
jgi:environmental stress-induced protein Ves